MKMTLPEQSITRDELRHLLQPFNDDVPVFIIVNGILRPVKRVYKGQYGVVLADGWYASECKELWRAEE